MIRALGGDALRSMWELDHHFGPATRLAQRMEHLRHLIDADHVSHHRTGIDFARRQRRDRLLEFRILVSEHEAHSGLLEYTSQRRDLVRFHADPEHHHPPERRYHIDRRFQHRLDADAFEDELGTAPGQLAYPRGRILDGGIDDLGSAEPSRKLDTARRDLGHHYGRGALGFAP